MATDERQELRAAIDEAGASLREAKAEVAQLRADLAQLGDGAAGSRVSVSARERASANGWYARRWVVWRVMGASSIALLIIAGWCGSQWRRLDSLRLDAARLAAEVGTLSDKRAWLAQGTAVLGAEIAAARGPAEPQTPETALSLLLDAERRRADAAEAPPNPDEDSDIPIWRHVADASCVMERTAMARKALREIKRINATSPAVESVVQRCREAGITLVE
jgi:outer membrane murein-binding lipoprotein Lpp